MKKLTQNIFLIIFILLIAACSKEKDRQDLIRYVKNLNKDSIMVIASTPKFVFPQSLQYDFDKGHSPFLPIKVNSVAPLGSELESYSLKSLTMVGVISDNTDIWALIKTPQGNVYPVVAGQIIGKSKGRITKIDAQQVEIEEILAGKQNHFTIKLEQTLVLNNHSSSSDIGS